MTSFESSWLVQRLERPFKKSAGILRDNPFSFGGGLVNGGLSAEAMKLLRDIFTFDYMGAAEFEFGAVPKALERMANSDLIAFPFDIDSRPVYVLTPGEWRDEVETRVRELAKDYGAEYYELKEPTRLHAVLNDGPYTDRLAGWLELDNGFMFFTDEEMWTKTCELFGVKP